MTLNLAQNEVKSAGADAKPSAGPDTTSQLSGLASGRDSVATLVELTNDSKADVSIQTKALERLTKMAIDGGESALVEIVNDKRFVDYLAPSFVISNYAAELGPAATPALKNIIANPESTAFTRQAATDALLTNDPKAGIEALKEILLDAEVPSVKAEVAAALSKASGGSDLFAGARQQWDQEVFQQIDELAGTPGRSFALLNVVKGAQKMDIDSATQAIEMGLADNLHMVKYEALVQLQLLPTEARQQIEIPEDLKYVVTNPNYAEISQDELSDSEIARADGLYRDMATTTLLDSPSVNAKEQLWELIDSEDKLTAYSTRRAFGAWQSNIPEGERSGAIENLQTDLLELAATKEKIDPDVAAAITTYADMIPAAAEKWPEAWVRFSPDNLQSLVENENTPNTDGKPVALLLQSKFDFNGAMAETDEVVSKLADAGYRIVLREAGTDTEALKGINDVSQSQGPIQVMEISAHGKQDRILLSAPDYSQARNTNEERRLDLRDRAQLNNSNLNDAFAPDAQIVLNSCSTGAGHERADNVANMILELAPNVSDIWAPTAKAYTGELKIADSGRLESVDFQLVAPSADELSTPAQDKGPDTFHGLRMPQVDRSAFLGR